MSRQVLTLSLVFLVLFSLWEYVSRSFTGLSILLPPPTGIIEAFIQRFDRLMFHAGTTIQEMVGALLLGCAVSFPLAWAMRQWQTVGTCVQGLFVVLQCLPSFTLAPLMLLWFGWSYTAIVVPTALMVVFPLTLGIYRGLAAAPEHIVEYFLIHGATPKQIFFKLQLPYALPSFFSGMRIALAISGIGALAGEWAGAQSGLGVLIFETREEMDLEMTFAALACVVGMSLLLYAIGISFEKHCHRLYRFVTSLKQLGLLALLLPCVGCQQKPATESVRLVLDWSPNPSHVPLYAGHALGFFAQEGIPIQIVKPNSVDPLQLVGSGQAELAISYMPRTLRAIANGHQFSIVGKIVDRPLNGFLCLERSGIDEVADLQGRLVGFSASGFSASTLDVLLRQMAIRVEKRNVGLDIIGCLVTKKIDVVYGVFKNIEPAHLQSLGYKTCFFSVTDFGMPDYDELVIVGSALPEETAIKLRRALGRSIDFCRGNPEKAFALYIAQLPDKGPKTVEWERKSWEETVGLLASTQELSVEKIERLCQWLKEKGLIQNA
ncbi:MAG: ABC transporter substrate-binding protein [Verrucomicrobia bacterium]|nr:ABC transporter substrate-binding protein [Verrucomicrobiota bacterium]